MRTQCFDIGTIQAFLDGETNAAETGAIADHISECAGCSALLADAEEENSFVFSALDREMNTLVPTQRLWRRINESIETERGGASFVQRLLAGISASLLNPSFAAAAAFVVFGGLLAFVWMNGGTPDNTNSVAAINVPVRTDAPSSRPDISMPVSVSESEAVSDEAKIDAEPVLARTANFVRERTPVRATRASYRAPKNTNDTITAAEPAAQYLPGEESYVRTIADLKRTVDSNGRGLPMSVSSRVAFERDMAVVDDAIAKMRDVVKKDPENQGAKQVLYTSYQNKIDLLNSVAQRDELMASIR